jgi:excisionase family DNA binding protein
LVPYLARSVVTGNAAQAASPEPLVYSVEQAADLLGVGRTFMFHLLATGEIESFKIGKRRKIARDALHSYINRLRQEQSASGSDGPAAPPPPGSRVRGGRQ